MERGRQEMRTIGKQSEVELYLGEKQVASMLGLAVQTLRNWRFQGRGPSYVKLGPRAVRYKLGDVLDFAEERRIEPQGREQRGEAPRS